MARAYAAVFAVLAMIARATAVGVAAGAPGSGPFTTAGSKVFDASGAWVVFRGIGLSCTEVRDQSSWTEARGAVPASDSAAESNKCTSATLSDFPSSLPSTWRAQYSPAVTATTRVLAA